VHEQAQITGNCDTVGLYILLDGVLLWEVAALRDSQSLSELDFGMAE